VQAKRWISSTLLAASGDSPATREKKHRHSNLKINDLALSGRASFNEMNAIRIDSPSWIRTAILSDIGIAAYSILESLMLSKHQATRWYAGSVCGPLIRPMPSKQAPIPNLDFFRACAVLFVLVDHTLD
jgi:hypothetical protein